VGSEPNSIRRVCKQRDYGRVALARSTDAAPGVEWEPNPSRHLDATEGTPPAFIAAVMETEKAMMRRHAPAPARCGEARRESELRNDAVQIRLPPGPRLPAFVQALHIASRPTGFLDDCARRFGDSFVVRLPGAPPIVNFSHPEAIREIFTADGETLCAGQANLLLGPLLGPGSLLLLDGARHLEERRLMIPPFHGERLRAYATLMSTVIDRAIASWPLGRPFVFHREMQNVTLEVIMRAVFGIDAGGHSLPLREKLCALVDVAANPLWLIPALQFNLGPLTPWARLARARREVEAILDAEFERRRATAEDSRSDVLSMLLATRHEDGRPMTDEELRDEMITLLLAGHETTATALAWTVYHVSRHPPVLAKIRAELATVVGGGGLCGDQVTRLEYLEAVVKEGLRLTPVLPDVGRMIQRPVEIGGWRLEAGVNVAPQIYLTHRRADLWPEPHRFDPERFHGRGVSPYAFLPFGGGARRCLGMAFALYEMKVVLARVFARTELQIAPAYVARPVRRAITLAPSRGVPIVLHRRTY
jgi:cytochrome P450